MLQNVAGNLTQARRPISIPVACDCCTTKYVVYDDLTYCFVPEATQSFISTQEQISILKTMQQVRRPCRLHSPTFLDFVILEPDLHHSSYTTAAKARIYCFFPRPWVAALQLSQSGAAWRPHTFAYRNHHLSHPYWSF